MFLMDKEYILFFRRVSKLYNSPGGYNTLEKAIELGSLREELGEKLGEREYAIAEKSLLEFFQHHNTTATNRIFGMGDFEINTLVNKCREME